jgi:hypothetical protein
VCYTLNIDKGLVSQIDKQKNYMSELATEKFEQANIAIGDGSPAICVGCGGRATRTNNTLCQACWNDAEGFEDNE